MMSRGKQVSFCRKIFVKFYLWLAEQLYHSLAWAYDFVAWLVSFGYWSQWRLDVLNYLRPGNVLETGFGTGSLLLEMNRQGYDVIGLEPSKDMQRVTALKIKKFGNNINRLMARAEEIPFPGETFNNIILTFPSNYIIEESVLREFWRVLRPGGQVVMTGMGVQFKARFKRWLTAWFLLNNSEMFIERILAGANLVGFKGKLIQHEAQDYVLSVVILEK
jgi:ubiquinone/menaquinone biosynthesis C-methylase UbiE